MTWDDETWPAVSAAARAIDAPPARLEAGTAARLEVASEATLRVATPCPRVRAVDGAPLEEAWARRLERWREVRAALDRLPPAAWPRTSPAWGWGEGDARAPVEAGGDAESSRDALRASTWRAVPGGVRGAVAAARPRRVVVRGGRRSGKSSNVGELAVADATSGTWAISAGDVGLPDRLVSLARLDKRAGKVQAPRTRHPPSG